MTGESPDLGGIVERDRLGTTGHPGPVKTYGLLAAADRHALIGLLRECRAELEHRIWFDAEYSDGMTEPRCRNCDHAAPGHDSRCSLADLLVRLAPVVQP